MKMVTLSSSHEMSLCRLTRGAKNGFQKLRRPTAVHCGLDQSVTLRPVVTKTDQHASQCRVLLSAGRSRTRGNKTLSYQPRSSRELNSAVSHLLLGGLVALFPFAGPSARTCLTVTITNVVAGRKPGAVTVRGYSNAQGMAPA